jgi:alanine racemase
MRHSSYLEVDLKLLGENISHIKRLSTAQIIPMVKANAYGNGLVPISRFLVEECHIATLGCASLGEALNILNECPKLQSEIMVFSDTEIQNEKLSEAYSNLNITPVLHQMSDVEAALTRSDLKKIPLVLKINTGMNRLGLSLDELERIAPKLKNRGVKHLMTHFATSYYPMKVGDKMHRQMDEFKQAKKVLTDIGVTVEETSVANSGAIEQNFGIDETYVRPGLMMYGPPSTEPRIWEGHQISKLITKVLKTFTVKKGTPVGYGINVAGEDGFIVVIPIGYGDGLMTFAAGIELMIKGFKGKLFARINMDMAFIMFDPSVEGKFKNEEVIEVWNHDNRVITDIATQMKTIPYQVMCGISSRIPRIYKV